MRILLTLSAFTVFLLGTGSAQAHFIWLAPVSSDDETTLQVYFAEDASSDDPALLCRVKGMKVYRITGTKPPVAVDLTLNDESLFAKLADFDGRSLFVASHDLGVFDRGDSVFRLKCYAKTGPAITSDTWERTESPDDMRLDLAPSIDEKTVTINARFDGKPVEGAQLIASGPGLDSFEATTDKEGKATFEMVDAGLYSIRVRHIEAEAGELEGKKYPETRHYSTLALNIPAPLASVASEVFATLPQPVTSFGAAATDTHVYLYGGHIGSAHSYSNEEQVHTLTRLDLKSRKWETVIDGPELQGLALVAHEGKIYRLGGFTAKNAQGEDADLWSQDGAAVYDPAANAWSDLPSLPEPRSSFDAAVLGDAIYVVGGWSLQGNKENHWHTTAWKLDLGQEPLEWQALPSPEFQRRALAVAAHDGKLYAIGGMQDGGPTRNVDVFDPASGQWSKGPELFGDDAMSGFGAAAFSTGGRLYASTIKGNLQRLSEDGATWEVVGKTPTARFFHRMLPLDDSRLLMIGGANMGIGKFEEVEVLSVAD